MTINGLIAKIIAKEGKIAQIEVEGQNLKIASEYLPANAQIGETVNLYFLDSKDSTNHEKKLAKEILNEILNGK